MSGSQYRNQNIIDDAEMLKEEIQKLLMKYGLTSEISIDVDLLGKEYYISVMGEFER